MDFGSIRTEDTIIIAALLRKLGGEVELTPSELNVDAHDQIRSYKDFDGFLHIKFFPANEVVNGTEH